MPPAPVRATWELTTRAGPAETWALFSDTERYNRAAGFDFRFDETPREDGGTLRRGSARFLGMDVRWAELPFQYRHRQWYRWERHFLGSPASRLVGTLRLKPTAEGTSVLYTIEAWPRSVFFRPAVAFELQIRSKPKIDRALAEMVSLLNGGTARLDPGPEPLSDEAASALRAIQSRLSDAEFARSLARFIESAPLPEQDGFSPLRLASAWGMAPPRAIRGCLEAVREGALTLSWDLLCPLCRSPKERLERLDLAGEVHCPSCNIRYDGTFSDSVSVRFRTAPALRRFEVFTACVGSPARQPHILAQDQVAPGAELVFELDLEPGLYRLRSHPHRDTASLSVGAEGLAGVALPLGGEARLSGRLELKAGPTRVAITSEATTPMQVLLETRALAPDVLTAGQLLEMPEVGELLPASAIAPDTVTETARRVVLAIDLTDARPARLAVERAAALESGATLVQARDGLVLASFPTLEAAIDAARASDDRGPCRLSLGAGPVLELSFAGGQHSLMGRVVDRCLVALWGSAPGKAAIDADLDSTPELREALERAGLPLERPGLRVSPELVVHRLVLTSGVADAVRAG